MAREGEETPEGVARRSLGCRACGGAITPDDLWVYEAAGCCHACFGLRAPFEERSPSPVMTSPAQSML